MDQGVDLMLCLNPLVPFDASTPLTPRVMQRGLAPEKRAHSAHRRRRPAVGAEPDLPLDDPLAHGTGHEALRARLSGHRHRADRTRPPRPRAVPGQHLQLPPAPPSGRTRVPADAPDAALAQDRPVGQAGAPRHHASTMQRSTTRKAHLCAPPRPPPRGWAVPLRRCRK